MPAPTNPSVGEIDVRIGSDTVWKEVFDTLSISEQSCISSALGDDLEWALDHPVWPEGSYSKERDVSIYSCLDPELARSVFLSLAKLFIELHVELNDEGASCLREFISDEGVADLIEAFYDSDESDEFIASLISCVPDLLFPLGISQSGWLKPEYFSEGERSCVGRLTSEADRATILAVLNESAESEDFSESLLPCFPDLTIQIVLAIFELSREDLTEEEMSCLKEKDWAGEGVEDYLSDLALCVPREFGDESGGLDRKGSIMRA